jgi:hypothetical protein
VFYSPVYYSPAPNPPPQPPLAPTCEQPAPAEPEEQPVAEPAPPATPPPIPHSTYFLVSKVVSCKPNQHKAIVCSDIDLDSASIPEDRRLLIEVAKQNDLTQGFQVTASFFQDDSSTTVVIRAEPLVKDLDKIVLLGTGTTTADALRKLLSNDP